MQTGPANRMQSADRPIWLVAIMLAPIVLSCATAHCQDAAPLRQQADAAEDDPPTDPLAAGAFAKPAPESITDLTAIEDRITSLAKRVMRCTVGVRVGKVWGSGVIVNQQGYVLTAAHVAGARGRPATFVLSDGHRVPGRTLGLLHGTDAAMMKITKPGHYPFAEIADAESIEVGAWCLATGHPGGYRPGRRPVVRLGRVVFARRHVIQSDCTLVGGDSGGPLFGIEGRVIGIHSRIGVSTNFNLHVAAPTFVDHWDELAAEAYLGVQGADHPDGTRLTTVIEGLPAGNAGFSAGDVIVKFGKDSVSSFDDLRQLVWKHAPGDEVTIEFLRGDAVLQKSVVLATRDRGE